VKKPISISVILPCFNEAGNIQKNIGEICSYLDHNNKNFEIIAVNDGSTDNTLELLQKFKKTNLNVPLRIISKKRNSGKGGAVKIGILRSQGDIVMFMDADQAIPIQELTKFIEAVKAGNDLVIASRFVGKIRIIKPVLWYRNIMEKVFRVLRMMIINNYDVQDTQCGFKAFTRAAAQQIFPLLTVKGWSFDVEVIFLAKKMGLKVKELPITLQNPQESHIRIVRDSISMFLDLIRIRLNDWQGKYN
jgi:dolichyl-phosphate beta-glucosyltransferase